MKKTFLTLLALVLIASTILTACVPRCEAEKYVAYAGSMYSEAHDMLVIQSPGGSKYFFGSDGYGNPLTEDITFTKRNLTVAIKAGTVITMDGEYQGQTWLIFNADGTYRGAWGAPHGNSRVGYNRTSDITFSIEPVITCE